MRRIVLLGWTSHAPAYEEKRVEEQYKRQQMAFKDDPGWIGRFGRRNVSKEVVDAENWHGTARHGTSVPIDAIFSLVERTMSGYMNGTMRGCQVAAEDWNEHFVPLIRLLSWGAANR